MKIGVNSIKLICSKMILKFKFDWMRPMEDSKAFLFEEKVQKGQPSKQMYSHLLAPTEAENDLSMISNPDTNHEFNCKICGGIQSLQKCVKCKEIVCVGHQNPVKQFHSNLYEMACLECSKEIEEAAIKNQDQIWKTIFIMMLILLPFANLIMIPIYYFTYSKKNPRKCIFWFFINALLSIVQFFVLVGFSLSPLLVLFFIPISKNK
jgi:hypothetical protein